MGQSAQRNEVDALLTVRAAQAAGVTVEAVELLPPHASTRRYARCRTPEGSRVVMLLPPPGEGPSEAGSAASAAVADEPFLVVAAFLAARGVRVPQVHGVSEALRTVTLEDVGDLHFEAWARSAQSGGLESAYDAGLAFLLDGMRRWNTSALPEVVASRVFTAEQMRWELDHYVQWRVRDDLGVVPDAGWEQAMATAFEALVEALGSVPRAVCHRDFQSHNLMVLPERAEEPELVLLDFQDMFVAPVPYDAVAFLRDSYLTPPAAELEALIDRWSAAVAETPLAGGWSAEALRRAFLLQTVQRKLKDAGRFVYIDRVRGNASFLRWIPSSLRCVREALEALDDPFGLIPLIAQVEGAAWGRP